MTKPHTLKNPPIVEALIDIYIQPTKEHDVHAFKNLSLEIPDFPIMQEQTIAEGAFKITNEDNRPEVKSHRLETNTRGYVYKNTRNTKMVQFRKDGFTFNKLKPYESWENVLADAKELWKIYSAKANYEIIKNIGIRYINHIIIPCSSVELTDYFSDSPKIPDELPQQVAAYMNNTIIILDAEKNIHANIIQAHHSSNKGDNQLLFVLDINVMQDIGKQLDNTALWNFFENLREMKNKIFFNYLKDKTIGLFE